MVLLFVLLSPVTLPSGVKEKLNLLILGSRLETCHMELGFMFFLPLRNYDRRTDHQLLPPPPQKCGRRGVVWRGVAWRN